MKNIIPYILIFLLLFGFVACKKQQDSLATTHSGLTSKTTITTDDDGDLFTWDDEGIEHIEKWAPKTFAGMPLDSISRELYDYVDIYELSLFYKTNNKHQMHLSIYDSEDEYVEPLIKPVQVILEKNISADTLGRKSKVVTKKGIKAIETYEKIENEEQYKITFIHKDRYVFIISGNTDLNKLWDGIAGLPLNNLK
ncbi:MAG TPA: hypothetical protein VLZ72_10910 [Flavobacterium sp.]|nr:hypothetical protein [Flavobacterium sp.]